MKIHRQIKLSFEIEQGGRTRFLQIVVVRVVSGSPDEGDVGVSEKLSGRVDGGVYPELEGDRRVSVGADGRDDRAAAGMGPVDQDDFIKRLKVVGLVTTTSSAGSASSSGASSSAATSNVPARSASAIRSGVSGA